jgi:hypothetical protein
LEVVARGGIEPPTRGFSDEVSTIRHANGNDDAILTTAMGLFVAGALLLLGLGRYPDLRSSS